ncbi:MAG: hypothetical protein ACK58N_16655 [Synechocystis sp.]|jgi:hypothetical protein
MTKPRKTVKWVRVLGKIRYRHQAFSLEKSDKFGIVLEAVPD